MILCTHIVMERYFVCRCHKQTQKRAYLRREASRRFHNTQCMIHVASSHFSAISGPLSLFSPHFSRCALSFSLKPAPTIVNSKPNKKKYMTIYNIYFGGSCTKKFNIIHNLWLIYWNISFEKKDKINGHMHNGRMIIWFRCWKFFFSALVTHSSTNRQMMAMQKFFFARVVVYKCVCMRIQCDRHSVFALNGSRYRWVTPLVAPFADLYLIFFSMSDPHAHIIITTRSRPRMASDDNNDAERERKRERRQRQQCQ